MSLTNRETQQLGDASSLGYVTTVKMPLMHLMDITQIIQLSDFETRL